MYFNILGYGTTIAINITKEKEATIMKNILKAIETTWAAIAFAEADEHHTAMELLDIQSTGDAAPYPATEAI